MDENMNLNNFEQNQPDLAQAPEAPAAPPVRRRRKRSKWQNFKEAYLPVIIAGAALVLCIVFISSALGQGKTPDEPDQPVGSTPPAFNQEEMLAQEAADLLARAEALAAQYDYEAAMTLLCTYSGGINNHAELKAKYDEYYDAFAKLVPYNNIADVPNLSFRLLMADLDRSLAHPDYGDSFNANYVTTGEFEKILHQLYDNGYMLVSIYDLAPKTVDANGNVTISQGTVYLPEGKQPLVLTQVGVNYFTYIVDSDGDGLADKDGAGFSCGLVLDENGEITSQMVDSDGSTITGNFDLVTILNDFIEKHPDFSYRGARATLAVTGYDGLFGYRTDPETAEKISPEYYNQQLADVKGVIAKLRQDGYDIACYSYDYADYASMSAAAITGDLELWKAEVTPLLGDVDILVFPYDDIGNTNLYNGPKFEVLQEYGFCYFIRKDSSTPFWGQISSDYARMSRREVTGNLMHKSADWFDDLFDSARVLDSARGFEE
ncbi:MAG: hypothetical protein IJ960_02515 [Oscillospiraceae bacterium]|nr:hypothetical protein [Oscillospiraceae bacterium]